MKYCGILFKKSAAVVMNAFGQLSKYVKLPVDGCPLSFPQTVRCVLQVWFSRHGMYEMYKQRSHRGEEQGLLQGRRSAIPN